MITPNRWLLGFDLRACAKDYVTKEWCSERRLTYLLNSNVEWPLSVDTAVWPSLFHFTSRLQNYRPVETVDVEPSTDRQLILRLWDDVAAMEGTLRNNSHDICFVRVAVELCADRNTVESGQWELLREPLTQDRRMLSEWRAVGFDVADSDFVSGLMNCGYEQKERAELSVWSRELNGYGLFDSIERASEFQRVADERVPEHAPFFVYQLLADLNGGG